MITFLIAFAKVCSKLLFKFTIAIFDFAISKIPKFVMSSYSTTETYIWILISVNYGQFDKLRKFIEISLIKLLDKFK